MRITVLALALLSLPLAAHARRCGALHYVTTSDTTALGGTSLLLAVDTAALTVSGGCPPTSATRRGARLVATWSACAGRLGLRLKARLSKSCAAVRGRLRGPGIRLPFTAAPSTCGDGVVDGSIGEDCEGTTCGDTVACNACRCGGEGCTDLPVEGEGSPVHVAEGSSIAFAHNPPTAGPHYPVWAPYRAYAAPVPRGYWIHNLEHGGVVLLYRPDAPADTIAALTAAYQALPDDPECDHRRAVLTPDPQLDTPFSVVAWRHELSCPTVDATAIQQFVADHRNRAPEDICTHGGYVP